MPKYVVVFELSEGSDKEKISTALRKCGEGCPVLDNAWVIDSTKSAEEILAAVAAQAVPSDGTLVAEISLTSDFRLSGSREQLCRHWSSRNSNSSS